MAGMDGFKNPSIGAAKGAGRTCGHCGVDFPALDGY